MLVYTGSVVVTSRDIRYLPLVHSETHNISTGYYYLALVYQIKKGFQM
jgi:hypothetical protein